MADPWINSLVQSPLVRTLNSVPSKSTSFVHGIADNVPPFSMDKVRVNYVQGLTGGTGEQYRFRIPQNGYWNRAYLKLYITKTNFLSNLLTPNNGVENRVWGTGVLSSASNAARIIREVTLQSHNKVIARLYGDTILARCQRLPEEQRRVWGALMRGFGSVSPLTIGDLTAGNATKGKIAWPYNVCDIDQAVNGALETEPDCANYAVVYVPLPFFCFQSLAHNFQTRFVEDLELWVTKKTLAEISGVIPGYLSADPELVCVFHTFHDTIENAIRNKNYKRGVPASILAYDDIEETDLTLSTSNATNDASARATAVFKLRSNHLISEIIIVHAGQGIGLGGGTALNAVASSIAVNLGRSYGPPVTLASPAGVNGAGSVFGDYTPLKIELTGSGRTLWTTDSLEVDADGVPYYLNTEAPIGYTAANAHVSLGNFSVVAGAGPSNNTANAGSTGNVDLNGWTYKEWGPLVSTHLYDQNNTVLRFAFDGNDSIHSGGLALQSLADPRLTITFSSPVSGATVATPYIKCYVKYRCLVRIDSDTGIVTRTMDV